MLFNEPKLLKSARRLERGVDGDQVSVLFNEPKLLKSNLARLPQMLFPRFSALQRAEIAEIATRRSSIPGAALSFSALQRAEIAEIDPVIAARWAYVSFSALQRAEIAEITPTVCSTNCTSSFSALQRAEIAEIWRRNCICRLKTRFQCSSTSRNC